MRQVLTTCLLLIWVAHAGATTITLKNFDELVAEADGIVIGTVSRTLSRYGPDGDIYTFVTLSDLELLKGSYGRDTLTVRIQGGEVQGEVLEIVGAPSFTPQDRVVVFLKGNGRHIVPFVGWSQGVYRVRSSAAGIEEVLDHDENRVFGIQGVDVLKERRNPAEAYFLAGPHGKSQSTHPGSGATGGSAVPQAGEAATGNQGPLVTLPLTGFMEAIKTRLDSGTLPGLGSAQQTAAELISVDSFAPESGIAESLPAPHSATSTEGAAPLTGSQAPVLPKPSSRSGAVGP